MNIENKEEILFQIDFESDDLKNRNKSRKTVKLAEKNLRKMLFNRLRGITGEC